MMKFQVSQALFYIFPGAEPSDCRRLCVTEGECGCRQKKTALPRKISAA
jgi:hypothetical protein